MKQYDYLIVGAGLYGAVFAQEAKKKAGKKCLVIDKRDHIAGNIYTEPVEGINVHRYGAHIFHTNNKAVWQYVNQFAEFNRYTNSPVANYHGEIYNLPFNMNTFNKMWGVVTPAEAKAKIEAAEGRSRHHRPAESGRAGHQPCGHRYLRKLIKGYTGKQWGRPCTELPAFIIKRLPVRFTYDDNYFNALYQGIPNGGLHRHGGKDAGRHRSAPEHWIIWPRRLRWNAWLKGGLHRPGGCLLSATVWVLCSTAASALRPRCWTPTIIRATRWSTTPTPRPLHPHHRAQALRVRHPAQDGHQPGVQRRVEKGRRAVLSRQRRKNGALYAEYKKTGRCRAGRDLRRPSGRVQVLRYGQRYRGVIEVALDVAAKELA